jgi:two-component system nitrate/nitrite response regulator NarL
MPDRIRFVVIDAQPIFRKGLAETIRGPRRTVVAEGERAADVASIVAQSKPDVLLIDISIPGNGIAAAEAALRTHPHIKIIILTASDDANDIADALRIGAQGYILKFVGAQELLTALDTIESGEPYITPALAHRLLTESKGRAVLQDKATKLGLTSRDKHVLSHLTKGLSNQEMADELGVTVRTTKYYLTQLFKKMRVHGRVEAILEARKLGLDTDGRVRS